MSARLPTQHDRCGTLRPLGEVVDDLVGELRFHRQVKRLHSLGPRAVGELLAEIGEQRQCRTFIDQRLKAYAALDPEILRELGGDQFPRPRLHKAAS